MPDYRNGFDESPQRLGMIAKIEPAVLGFLAKGGSYTPEEIHNALKKDVGSAYIWETLRKFEAETIVFRAFDYNDWRTLHKWKITGCGLISAQS